MSTDAIDQYLHELIGDALIADTTTLAAEPAATLHSAPTAGYARLSDAEAEAEAAQERTPLALAVDGHAPAHDGVDAASGVDADSDGDGDGDGDGGDRISTGMSAAVSACQDASASPGHALPAASAPAPLQPPAVDELEALFDAQRAIWEQQSAAQDSDAVELVANVPAPVQAPAVDELEALFDAQRTIWEQQSAAQDSDAVQPTAPAPAPVQASPVDELEALFDAQRAIWEQQSAAQVSDAVELVATAPAPVQAPAVDELEALFDSQRAVWEQQFAGQNADAAGQLVVASAPLSSSPVDELEALFDSERQAWESQQEPAAAATPVTMPAMASPATTAPASGNPARVLPAPPASALTLARPAAPQPLWQPAAGNNGSPPGAPEHRRRASEKVSRWLRLRCGAQPYALELLKVQEVVLPVPLLPLRGTQAHMLGIMNLRGQVVPVMDLGLFLDGEAAHSDAATRIVVLESDGQTLGLRVSAVDDVATLSESQIEPPDTVRLCRFTNHLFRGISRLGGPPMILLDAGSLLN